MISRENINKLPSSIREEMATHFRKQMELADRESVASSMEYVRSDNPRQRSAANEAFARAEVYRGLYNLFK